MKTAFRYKDTLNMTNLTMLITSKCTLQCKLCATYTTGHPHPKHYDYAILTKSVARYFDSVNKEMGIMTISGGEPFMHPQLPEFLKFVSNYASRVKMIEIITNGTIVPSDRLINAMRHCPKFNLMIDNYGTELSVNLDTLVEKLERNDIGYRVRNYTQEDAHLGGWIDVSDFSEKHRTEAEIADIFHRCAYNNIHKNIDFIINGKVYMCYVNHDALPEVEELPEESVNLMDTGLTNEEIAAAISNLRNRRFLLACTNCNGYLTEDGVRQKPAEQID